MLAGERTIQAMADAVTGTRLLTLTERPVAVPEAGPPPCGGGAGP